MILSFRNSGLFVLCFLLAIFSGCVPVKPRISEGKVTKGLVEPERKGVYHKVARGETVWRIAKVYNVPISEIVAANNIPNMAQVEVNQLLFIPGAEQVQTITIETQETANDFIWPVEGKVTHYFHQSDGTRLNQGIDIQAKEGDDVKASRSGRVVFADYLSGYGDTVILDHLDGYFSVYGHNAKILVQLGEIVVKNHTIAHVGRSNNLAFLHFQIRKNAMEDNPLYYLP